MDRELKRLLEQASQIRMTPEQQEEQRRSFAYGNLHFEDPTVTREMIDDAAEILAAEKVVDGRRK